MHDLGYFRSHFDAILDRLATRGFSMDRSLFLDLDTRRRAAVTETETLRAALNADSQEIGRRKKAGEDTTAQQESVRAAKERIAVLEESVKALDDEFQEAARFQHTATRQILECVLEQTIGLGLPAIGAGAIGAGLGTGMGGATWVAVTATGRAHVDFAGLGCSLRHGPVCDRCQARNAEPSDQYNDATPPLPFAIEIRLVRSHQTRPPAHCRRSVRLAREWGLFLLP